MHSRRTFLTRMIAGALALAVAPFAYVAARFLGPVRSAPAAVTLRASEVPAPGSTRAIKVGAVDALLMRATSGSLMALRLECTHMACNVNWKPERGVFHCPCHNGLFSADGAVLGGPPRRPLARLQLEELPGGGVRITESAS